MRTAQLTPEDEQYLTIGEHHRDSLMKTPMLSGFRVVAVFAYETLDGEHKHIVGGNCECANVGAALCAERSAICQLQFLPVKRVRAVYIVSDADVCLTPGTLCREFLSSSPFFTPQTPFITRAPKCKPCVTTLEELFPFPSVYSHILRADVLAFGVAFCRKGLVETLASDATDAEVAAAFISEQLPQLSALEQQAYSAACRATAKDARDDLFPLRSAAAVVFSDDSVRVAWQHKTLEYGSSLDAISKLIPFIEEKADGGVRPAFIAQVDQFGIAHAPSARARAYLFEYGFSKVEVLVHDGEATLRRVRVDQLVFESPDVIASSCS
jgi:cytidine deaminase